MLCVSCKTQTNYNKEAYTEIMENSVTLLAKEEKGKVQPGSVVRLSDTLYVNDKLPKSVVDSINNARKLEYKK